MGSSTLAAALALVIGLVFPCWAGIILQPCVPGATFADFGDSTRYYRCLADGRIKAYDCTEGGKSCEEGDSLCCAEESESTYESWSVDRIDKGTQTEYRSHEVQSSDESMRTAEDETYDFVGKGFKFASANDESYVKPLEEPSKSTEHQMHSKEEGESRDEGEHEGTETNADVSNVPVESDGEQIRHIGSEIQHDSSSAEKVAGLYGVNNESDNRDEHNPHNVVIVESESNEKTLEVSRSFEHSRSDESKEKAKSGDYRWKRNANDEDDEKDSSNEKADEDKESNKNHGSEIKFFTMIDSSEDDTSESQSQSDSLEEKNIDESSNLESNEDNVSLETTKIPSADTHVGVNPSEVANFHGEEPLPHSYMDNRTQQIIQIVRSILRLTEEKPTPIHREMLSPEKDDGMENH